MGTDHSINKPIIFFDGVCNLCNSSIQFIIKRDRSKKFLFASLQSAYARENLPTELSKSDSLQSIVLKEGSKIQTKSSAALRITKSLDGLWPILFIFIVVPKFLRDWMYDGISRNRYMWFGKRDQCMIPSSELKSRFLD